MLKNKQCKSNKILKTKKTSYKRKYLEVEKNLLQRYN